MAIANLASTTKLSRATEIITAIGSGGFMQLWTGTIPVSPDLAPHGTRLVSLPLADIAGVASYGVQQAVVTAAGSGGVIGDFDLLIVGDGEGAAGFFSVAAGVLQSITIDDAGHGYTAATLGGFGTAGLTGATATAVLTATVVFNPILPATAVATGHVGWARITDADEVGILDLDVGTTNAATVVMDNTFISSGDAVACSAQVLIEA